MKYISVAQRELFEAASAEYHCGYHIENLIFQVPQFYRVFAIA